MLTAVKVPFVACKCVFYRSEHNAKGGPHGTEYWRSWIFKNGSLSVYFADDSKILANVKEKHLSAPERSFWVLSENDG